MSHGLVEVRGVGVGGKVEQGAEDEGILAGGGRGNAESAWDDEGVRKGVWEDGSSGIWRGVVHDWRKRRGRGQWQHQGYL